MAAKHASGNVARTAVAALVAVGAAFGHGGCGEQKTLGQLNVDPDTIPVMPTPIVGQASLSGRVIDGNGQPVPGATVTFAETGASATTDAGGAYAVVVPSDSTLTLFASAVGLATTSRESVVLAARSAVTGFDVTLLAPADVASMSGLGGADPMGTHGLVAVRLHSMDPRCAPEGGHLAVWPPAAASVIYSRPSVTGGLDAPDPTVDGVQPGAQVAVWLAAAVPPGNMLTISFQGAGCALMAQVPSQNGLLYPGLRHVMSKALTTADLFLTVAP